MIETLLLYVLLVIAIIMLMIPAKISHWLNNLMGLPHPGPKDRQGSCSCREHEGPNEYSFLTFITGKKK